MANTLNELLVGVQELVEKIEVIGFGAEGEAVIHNGQSRGSIASAISDQFLSLKTMMQGRESFATKALMDADLAHSEDVIAEVWNDPVRENNGLYGKLGLAGSGSWEKSTFDDYSAVINNIKLLEKSAESVPKTATATVFDFGIHRDFNQLLSATNTSDDIVAGITDENGYAALMVTKAGEVIIPFLKMLGINVGGEQVLSGEYNYEFAIVDDNGNVGAGLLDGQWFSNSFSGVESIAVRDSNNVLKSENLKQVINTTHAINQSDYNHIVVYGQSLSTGQEGWPALSKSQDYGNLMLGGCVRPISTSAAGFSPFGGDVLVPLVANVQSGGAILTDVEVAALAAGSGALGEVVNQGMVNFAKRMHDRSGFSSNSVFVTTNNGVSGKTIEQLSKNNTQDEINRYGRYIESVQKIKAIADLENKSFAVTGIIWMQGEWNYSDVGGSVNLTDYKNLLKTLRDDMVFDANAITAQKEPPVFITYQTGASYARDIDEFGAPGLHVGMAQWEFSSENADCFLAGPVYPYTDKGGHLDANGYRWFGNYLGKIYHKVCTLGQSWSPLSPTKVGISGRDVHIDFHVPEPPLMFDLPYVSSNETDYTNKGFRVTDGAGDVPFESIEIIHSTIVKIVLSRDVDESAKIWYASQATYDGNGCLRDSDSIVALDDYEYLPDSGMYLSANIPALNGKPYPLHNWCIAFCLPITWSI